MFLYFSFFVVSLIKRLEREFQTERVLARHGILCLIHVGERFRVKSAELGESQQVLPLRIDTCVGKEVRLFHPALRKGIADHQVLQTQERSIFQEAGVHLRRYTPAGDVGHVARFLPAVVEQTLGLVITGIESVTFFKERSLLNIQRSATQLNCAFTEMPFQVRVLPKPPCQGAR